LSFIIIVQGNVLLLHNCYWNNNLGVFSIYILILGINVTASCFDCSNCYQTIAVHRCHGILRQLVALILLGYDLKAIWRKTLVYGLVITILSNFTYLIDIITRFFLLIQRK